MRTDVLRQQFHDKAEADRLDRQEKAAKIIEAARRRAILDADYLTRDPVWDRYLQRVNEWLTADSLELADLERMDQRTDYQAPEETLKRRHQMALLRERIGAYQRCIEMPKVLAEEARNRTV